MVVYYILHPYPPSYPSTAIGVATPVDGRFKEPLPCSADVPGPFLQEKSTTSVYPDHADLNLMEHQYRDARSSSNQQVL
jgi:hypothetical protein